MKKVVLITGISSDSVKNLQDFCLRQAIQYMEQYEGIVKQVYP